jgi:hypothetical protein
MKAVAIRKRFYDVVMGIHKSLCHSKLPKKILEDEVE